jgi:hypothetical protein
MTNLPPAEWRELRLKGNLTNGGCVVNWDEVRLYVVHEYANFVSSAEMVTTGQHLGKGFDPPVNTHISHAFLLNCRKMADFFSKRLKEDDVIADDYVPGFTFQLCKCDLWRDPVNKQLPHITYTRDTDPREITKQANFDMYDELKQAWKIFRGALTSTFAAKFEKEIKDKLKPESEFRDLDLW